MTTYIRPEPEPDDGTAFLLGYLVAAVLSALLWTGLVWVGKSLYQLYQPKEVPTVNTDACEWPPGWDWAREPGLPRGYRGKA